MVLDDLGAEVPVRDRARRIVSLVPSLTEAVASIAADRIVGATDYCTEPATLDVPRVGGSKYPTVSRILDCEPDLVVANSEENRREEVDALRAAGVPVWVTAAPATVDAALTSLQRLFTECLGERAPDWLAAARRRWARSVPRWACAVIPVWRKPWVVIGRDTFAADVLLRLGVGNAYAQHAERYPRPPVAELRAAFDTGAADLLVLPDEPYEFTAEDGPEAFPGVRYALVSGRLLTWYGPSLLAAAEELEVALRG